MFTTVALLKMRVTAAGVIARPDHRDHPRGCDRPRSAGLAAGSPCRAPAYPPVCCASTLCVAIRQILRSYTIAVLNEPEGRGGSREIHEIATADAIFEVRPPKNNFELVDTDNYVFIGGGIGITPIMPMVSEARRRGAGWRLIYGGRTESSMAYRETIAAHGDAVDLWVEAERGHPDLRRILAEAPAGARSTRAGPARRSTRSPRSSPSTTTSARCTSSVSRRAGQSTTAVSPSRWSSPSPGSRSRSRMAPRSSARFEKCCPNSRSPARKVIAANVEHRCSTAPPITVTTT